MSTGFTFCECPDCEFTAIYRTVDRPIAGFVCALCLEDNGHVVAMTERDATNDDGAEHDVRIEIGKRIAEQVKENVRRFGQHVWGVGGSEVTPPFAYTVGNASRGLPELLFIGEFHFDLGMQILNAVAERMVKDGRLDEGMLDIEWTFPFKVREAGGDVRDMFTIQASRYLGHQDYRVMQIMICDPKGRYPGDPGVDPRYDVEQP